MAPAPHVQARRDRNDVVTALIVGGIAAGAIVVGAFETLSLMFSRPGETTVRTPITPEQVTLTGGIPATVSEAQLSVPGVSTIAVVFLALGVVITATALLAVVALGGVFCVRMQRGEVFSARNTRTLFAMSMTLFFGPLAGHAFAVMGRNGLFAAVGSEFDESWPLLLEISPALVGGIAVGVLVIVFRRGERLQRDTEGLV